MRPRFFLLLCLFAGACSLIPPPDQPASVPRLGRFIGLVARCECSNISTSRILAEFPRAVSQHYSAAQIDALRGYVELGATERFDNQIVICAEACSQTCMVNAIAGPLGGALQGNGAACLVSERDLHLTMGTFGRNF